MRRILLKKAFAIPITVIFKYLCSHRCKKRLSEQKALGVVTISPTKNLRIDHRDGSIESGIDADLVLWSHHPVYYESKPLWTMIVGQIMHHN